jgi:hypothetical protein
MRYQLLTFAESSWVYLTSYPRIYTLLDTVKSFRTVNTSTPLALLQESFRVKLRGESDSSYFAAISDNYILLAEADTIEDLVHNYPELFI